MTTGETAAKLMGCASRESVSTLSEELEGFRHKWLI